MQTHSEKGGFANIQILVGVLRATRFKQLVQSEESKLRMCDPELTRELISASKNCILNGSKLPVGTLNADEICHILN